MSRVRRILLCCIAHALGACSEPVTRVDLQIEVAGCDPAELAAVRMIALEAFGSDAESACVLDRRCVPVSEVGDDEDLQTALREATQPLLDLPRDGVEFFVVTGLTSIDCASNSNRQMCGLFDVAETGASELTLSLRCDQCTDEEYLPCD